MKDQEANIKFDFHRITLGNCISIATGILAVFLAYSNIKSELAVMKNDIAWIKDKLQASSTKNPIQIVKTP